MTKKNDSEIQKEVFFNEVRHVPVEDSFATPLNPTDFLQSLPFKTTNTLQNSHYYCFIYNLVESQIIF